jgi:hypothetical protein
MSATFILYLSPHETARSMRQALALPHVLDAPGWRAEDV